MDSFSVFKRMEALEQHGREIVERIKSRPEQWAGEHADAKWENFINMDWYYTLQLTYSNLLLVETMRELRNVR